LERGDVHTGFLLGNPRKGHHLEDPGLDRRIFRKWDGGHGLN